MKKRELQILFSFEKWCPYFYHINERLLSVLIFFKKIEKCCTEEANPVLQGLQDHPRSASGRCFSCGLQGHLAKDCKEKHCFPCGEKGHIKQDCKNDSKDIIRLVPPFHFT